MSRDIKEKRRDKATIKEKRTSPPKTLLKKRAIHSVSYAKQQIESAAQSGVGDEQVEQSSVNGVDIIQNLPRLPNSLGRKAKYKANTQEHYREHSTDRNTVQSTSADRTAPVSNPKDTIQKHTHSSQSNGVDITTYSKTPSQKGRAAQKQMVQKRAARKENINVEIKRHIVRSNSPSTPVSTPTTHTVHHVPKLEYNRRQTIKTAPTIRTIKTAPEAGKTIKASEVAIKSTGVETKAVQAAKGTAQRSTYAAKAVAKANQTAKQSQKGLNKLAAAIKDAAVSTVKSIAAVLGTGGGLLVVVLLVIILAAGLLLSPLGIFFSGSAEGEMTLQQAMIQLNTEFSDRITAIEDSVVHDDVQQIGQRALWKEILTVYAVKTTTDTENAMDAVTMDDEHFNVLQEIFWDMNTIDHTTELYTEEVTVEVPAEDSSEEAVEETETVELTRLLITINSKTAEQMAEEYGFTQEQLGYVSELLSDEYADFWAMLSVPGVGSDDIVEVALSQVGNGGDTYWSWYGFSSRVSWCACFVSWCADQCGYIDAGIFPKFSYCDTGIDWFKAQGQWQDRYYVPAPGDIIFFDWNGDGTSDHVAIVESCDGATVYTVEGNANDLVKRLSYAVGSSSIMGYGALCA